DWSKHKVFAVKHWYDVKWDCPPPSTNPTGTSHEFVTKVTKYSDGTPLAGYMVTYKIMDGPAATLDPGGGTTAMVNTDSNGEAKVTIRQSSPVEGTNNVAIEIMRPENAACCKPAVKIADCQTSKTWVCPKITISKTCTPSVMVGEAVTYNITVTNPSSMDANNVTVTDSMPAGITMESATPPATSGNSWNLGTLKAGGSATITINAKATGKGKGLQNCAEVTAGPCNLQAKECCTTDIGEAALVLEKHCTAEVTVCDPIEYTVIVRNTGDGTARNVKITDQLPDGILTTSGKNSVVGNVGDLGPNQAKQLRFTAKASRTGSFTNSANASADGGLAATATCTTVVKEPKLTVSKTGPATRFINRDADYQITGTNNGDTVAAGTVLRDPIPAGTSFVSATEGGTMSGSEVVWQLGDLQPGQSKTVGIKLKAVAKGSAKNVAYATARCAEGKAETSMDVRGIPAVLLEVVDQDDPDEVGTTETYTITVTNQGSEDATNVRITAEVQPEADYVSSSGATTGTAAGRTVTFAPLPSLAPRARAEWKVVIKSIKAGDTRFKVQMLTDQIQAGGAVSESESTNFYE
ncbi:MAG: hypothetical protein U1A27_10855, partial [Phycisphaerae bacterium]